MKRSSVISRALLAAFPHTIPILTGFLFLGTTYGIYMRAEGFSFWYPLLISITVFAGSMQFVAVNLLLGAFDPIQALAMTLMINARHLFYGVSMLEHYEGSGWKKPYLIFGLCDETFSVNCSAKIPEGVDRHWFMFWVTVLDQFYWVAGSALGGFFGGRIPFDTEGLDFVMTAMFVVIFLEHWLGSQNRTNALCGLGLSALCLVLFGADRFMIPAMAAILGCLLLLRPRLQQETEVDIHD